jgi:hypothetical protein
MTLNSMTYSYIPPTVASYSATFGVVKDGASCVPLETKDGSTGI